MQKLISMCLYGDLDMYIRGAKENIALLSTYYPGWKLRIYCSEARSDLDCEVVVMGPSKEHSGMFWRFLPIWEAGLERVIVRDTDSRFNTKEMAAVLAWEQSSYIAHSMHDHDHHRCYPLFGGMFGIKCNVLPNKSKWLERAMKQPQARVEDMKWLSTHVWPEIINDTLHHSSVVLKWPSSPFPVQENGYFVGQQRGDNGPIW